MKEDRSMAFTNRKYLVTIFYLGRKDSEKDFGERGIAFWEMVVKLVVAKKVKSKE